MSAFTNVDVAAINANGVIAFENSGLLDKLKYAMEHAGAHPTEACDAMELIKSLCEGVDQWIEPYLVSTLPDILENLGTPKVAAAAADAGHAILHKSNPHSVRVITSFLFESLNSMKWHTKKGALVLIGALASHHPVVVQRNLPELILKLIEMSSDVKKEVKEQTKIAFGQLCATITNVDIVPIIPKVVAAYMDPVKQTEAALDALIATTFINDVDVATLGLLVPILTKGMRERKVVIKRRAALVIGNMCKLVNDPRTAAQFYPILQPVLERGIEEIAVEEVRKVCTDSLTTLHRVSEAAHILSEDAFKHEDLVNSINTHLSKFYPDAAHFALLVDFMAKGAHFLVMGDIRDEAEWNECMIPYLTCIVGKEAAEAITKEVIAEATAKMSAERADPEEEEEDLCTATFSLAYGTRVLLHQTPFRVKKGRKYGLVGPNGAGKSTLMKSIASGNLQGFPTDIITVYVECEIIGEKAEMSVLDYIMSDAKIQQCQVSEDSVRHMLTEMGFGVSRTAAALNAEVGTLSGGWRMKLALSRAMLLKPDMLLLDGE